MEERWVYIVHVFVSMVIKIHGDTEVDGDIGQGKKLDPIKEMLKRFDASPWTVFAVETTTSIWEREMREYLQQHEQMDDLEKEMKIHGIIPDYLTDPPEQLLDLKYKDHLNRSNTIHLGEIYTPTLCLEKPIVKYKTDLNASYVHLLIDPDHVCSRFEPEMDSYELDLHTTIDDGIAKTFVHYMKVNVPHTNITHGGHEVVEYLPPHPPNGTGLHRYMYLVYKQPRPFMNFTEKHIEASTAYERDWFKLSHFERKYNLTIPAAGIFFYARFDESVPYIYAGLHDIFI